MKNFKKAVLLGFTVLLMVVGICLPPSATAKTIILSNEELGGVIGSSGGSSLTVNHFINLKLIMPDVIVNNNLKTVQVKSRGRSTVNVKVTVEF